MRRIGMGLVGPGFVAAHHIDAVRRLGFVDVVAIADGDPARARARAAELGVPKVYGTVDELVADPEIHVVHNTTPNYLHGSVIRAAIARGKHVVSEKPLAVSAAEAHELWTRGGAGRRRPRRDVQLPGESARATGARDDRAPARSAARISFTAPICRTGCSSRRIFRGAWSPRRAAPVRRSPTSDRTGATSRSTSPAQRIVAVLADCATVVPTRRRPATSRAAFSDGSAAEGEPTR